MTFGGRGQFQAVGQTDLDGARRQIDMARDAGVNTIDTADVYSDGAAEEIVGRALEGRRDECVLCHQGAVSDGTRTERCRPVPAPSDRACEASLRRLRTDHIDLYQVHEWDGQTPLEETLGGARAPRPERQGALRRLLELRRLAGDEGARDRRSPSACRGSSASRSTCRCRSEARSTRSCPRRSIRASACSSGAPWPEASCPASTAATSRRRPGSRHASEWDEPPVYDEDKLYDTVDVLVEIADAHDVSPARVALAWLRGRPGITTVIVGARTDEQLADNLAAAELELSADEAARLEEVSRPPLLYPYWHQRKTAADRLSSARSLADRAIPGAVAHGRGCLGGVGRAEMGGATRPVVGGRHRLHQPSTAPCMGAIPARVARASGAAVSPWAKTDRPTGVGRGQDRSVPGRCASSTAITANTIEASPRGPNQPRKPTVRRLAPLPIMAIATGSIRTTVRLSTAYAAALQVRCSRPGPSRIAPKIEERHAAEQAADLLVQAAMPRSDSRADESRISLPARNAAMNPEPPRAEGDPVGERRAGDRNDLNPRFGDQSRAPAGHQDGGDGQPGDHAAEDPVADLLGHDLHRVLRKWCVGFDICRGQRDQQQRYADSIVEPALDVEALPDPGGSRGSVTTACPSAASVGASTMASTSASAD